MNMFARLQRSAFALPAAVALALAAPIVSEVSYRKSRAATDQIYAVSAARIDVQRVLSNLIDTDAAFRDYLLTGSAEYLEPYRKARLDLPLALVRLKRHYTEDADHGNPMARIERLANEKMSLVAEGIRLYNAGQHDRWRELLLSNAGKARMDEIRNAVEQLVIAETTTADLLRKEIARASLVSRVGIAAMVALSLLVLLAYVRQRGAGDMQLGSLRESVRAELQTQIEDRTRELAELARYLQTAREDERSRLARALHDELGSLLTAAKLDAARVKTRVAGVSPEAVERLGHLNDTLNSIIAITRRITEDLRPSTLGNLGLVPALEILARDFATGAGIRIDCALQPVALTPARELTAFRLVQEALTNISKYAKAQSVRIALEARDGQAVVSVTDDGVGFDLRGAKMGSYGLLGMRYRVEGEGGLLIVESTPGAGTTLSATLPLETGA